MVLQASDYLVVPKACPTPKARLVCFPHSGGGPSAFGAWPDLLDEHHVEVVIVATPGRERRFDVAAIEDWRVLVDEICEALKASGLVDDVPYAFLGHSLGALLAYEAARLLDADLVEGRPRPVHLFASGHGAPSTVHSARAVPAGNNSPAWRHLNELGDAELIEAVGTFGFLPQHLAANAALLQAVLPALRADFRLYGAYAPEQGRPPLPLKITALGGREDATFPLDELWSWREETTRALDGVETFPGGHFFIDTQRSEVVEAVLRRLDIALSELPISILKSNLPPPEACQGRLMHEVVQKVARNSSEADAVVDEREIVTYGEISRRVDLVSNRLQTECLHGKLGEIVALLMPHDANYIVSMLAIWQAASALVVIEPHFPAEMVKEVCEGCRTAAALTTPMHASKFASVQDCQTLVLDATWDADWPALARQTEIETPRARMEDTCILMMTSGTTGRPKQIAGSHYFLHVGHLAKHQPFPYTSDDNREGFNVMFVWEAIRPLLLGMTSFLIPDAAVLDPQLFVSTLQRHRCSRVLTTPSLLGTILQFCANGLNMRLETMRTWLTCGEVLPMRTVQSFRQLLPACRLVNSYGTWESGDVSFALVAPQPDYEPSQIFAAVGQLAPGVVVAIVDPDTRQALPRGVTGELYIGGPILSSGYFGQPDVTAERFVDGFLPGMREAWWGKWYKSGDAGRLIGDPPVLELRGRIDSTVKIRGYKVGIPVVEAAIQEVDGVALCAVFPVYETPAVVDSLLCLIQTQEGLHIDSVVQHVKKEAVKAIPRWMMPAYFRQMPDDAFSGGENRKLDRKRLAQLADLKTLRESQAPVEQVAATLAGSEVGNDGVYPASAAGQEDMSSIRGVVKAVWAKVLNLNPIALDPEENFFDLGGHSTLAAQIAAELSDDYGLPVTVLDIYSHSSLAALMDFVDGPAIATGANAAVAAGGRLRGLPRGAATATAGADGIAIVGLAGRFPGADDAEAFWENLRRATVSATFLSKDFLRRKGVSEETIGHKDFVPCAYMINDADKFDHHFFGIGRHEASLMDPQHRVFVETSWAAMENAALAPKGGLSDTVVGVFAAAGIDGYLVHHLDGKPLKDTLEPQDIFLAEIGNEKDYIATRVSYLLDFTGPSMNINSACSSALVASVQGAASIAAGQCDAAIVGAASITFPNLGYLYQDGLVNSVDGYIRPFDTDADGTVFGDSIAALVLRRKADTTAGLSWATLRGFSVSNDGGQKAGYAAPSPVGQSMAIMAAMHMMGEDPWSLTYVECHATGTRVGDGIEVRGLISAFNQVGGVKGPTDIGVALGSVKGNIAHANCAAGATGLVKTLMMMRSRELLPTANFRTLNPKVNLEGTPFFINSELCPWEVGVGKPMRAGVSSFGIGGTNAHTILEASPTPVLQGADKVAVGLPFHLLPFSAKTPSALKGSADGLAAGLRRQQQGGTVAGAAYTLQAGRSSLPLRKAVVVASTNQLDPEAGDLVSAAHSVQRHFLDDEELEELDEAAKRPTVAFIFPGQGSQYFGMARDLYEHVPLFRSVADKCCELLSAPEHLGFDLRPIIFSGDPEDAGDREEQFARPTVTQPSLFVIEHSLCQVLLAVGVMPITVAGHSLGEYAAAVAGGLLTLESAVAIVAARAKSTETLAEEGAMLSVAEWTEEELATVSNGERPGLWLAAVNSPMHAVISGEVAAVDALEADLKAAGRKCTRVHVQKAFHSGLIAKAADTLKGLGMPAEKLGGEAASVPVASNQTGGWMNALQLQDGAYWTHHMRSTVLWRQNAEKIMAQWQPTAFLEVGPGNALSMLTSKCVATGSKAPMFVQAMRHPKAVNTHDVEALLVALGRLWEVGCAIDWHALHTKVLNLEHAPAHFRLPGYAFDKTTLWANPERSAYVDTTKDPAPVAYGFAAASAVQDAAAVPGSPAPSRALIRFGGTRNQEPSIRAYCLPFASGSATVFAPWTEHTDDAVEVIAIELPGRGARSDEKIPANDEDDEAMLDSLCEAILADLRGAQYVLVGFSMGGCLSAELALRMATKKAPLPLALYVAGRKPPALNLAAVGDITMTNEELAEYAFAPPEVAQSLEFMEHVVPLLRADLGVDARAERRLSSTSIAGRSLPVGVGFEVYCGTNDTVAPWSEAPGWQRLVPAPVGVHYFPGGHEFMQEMRPMLQAAWRRDAIGRLVQRRSAELTLLATQGFAAPGGPLGAIASLDAANNGTTVAAEKPLPLHAVRWVQAVASAQEEVPLVSFFVDLGCNLSDAVLDSARAAMQSGTAVVAACAPASGVLSTQGEALEPEIQQCWQFTRLVQHLLEAGLSGRLVVICAAAASGAMVAGASKAVAMEAAELRVQRVFVPHTCLHDVKDRIGAISSLVCRYAQETDLWIQDPALHSSVFNPRIEPMAPPSCKLQCVPKYNSNGGPALYVLTGATGGLGRSVVEWLVREQGLSPDQLVLLRRQGSSALSGDLVRCRSVEVESPDCREALLTSGLRNLGSVTGIFHLAGVLDDGILSGMTEERFRKVVRPKCGILSALMHAVGAFRWSVQWVIGFSSTSSLFGYAGQSNYCAANAMLDQLAAFGTSDMLPPGDRPPCRVLAINWGPWAEAGMAKVGTKAYEQALAEGDKPLPTATALSCLAAVLRCAGQAQPAAVQVCACDVDWQRSQWKDLPVLDLVLERSLTSTKDQPESTGGAEAAAVDSPQKRIEDFLVRHTKSGNNWKRIQGKSLHQLGFDSLEIVQLRNMFNKHFGVNVPLSTVADPSQQLNILAPALCRYIEV
eukprot:CAMPEP_0115241604 /NCGR_PEP_ID=MMETSP0270-20121206/38516_1 /TAXON_ID=71861 /ORGANISM="Scrippsiella trochoidea, Strain CCMP3099" /LENGTH=2756 /DNA_ID=CAMNT_0002656631 /DNA_START=62 /DNA_END=8332 /DNA_ORIENTATION=-